MEKLDKAIKVIDELQASGLIAKYAVGGGIAVIFYSEVFSTYDLDIFFMPTGKTHGIIDISPLYNWFAKKGYRAHKEHIIVEDIPIQLLPAYNDLVVDAIDTSITAKYKNAYIKVFRPEYLIAIMLQTSRHKDYLRITEFLDNVKFDRKFLSGILKKHNLKNKFDNFLKTAYGK